jgi:hypothetical protein
MIKKDMKVRLISVEWGSNSSAAAFKTAAMLAVSKLGITPLHKRFFSVLFSLGLYFHSPNTKNQFFLKFCTFFLISSGMKSGPAILEPVLSAIL